MEKPKEGHDENICREDAQHDLEGEAHIQQMGRAQTQSGKWSPPGININIPFPTQFQSIS